MDDVHQVGQVVQIVLVSVVVFVVRVDDWSRGSLVAEGAQYDSGQLQLHV
jgi:hypothetical protein